MRKFYIFSIELMCFWIILTIVQLSDAKNNRTMKIPLIKGKRPSKHVRKRDTTDLHLTSVNDDYYYGWIKCGTPGQDMRMIFDTGSSDMWVMSSIMCEQDPDLCDSCGHNVYDRKRSRTFEAVGNEWSIQYQDDSYFSGFWVQDNVQVQDLVIEGQVFAEATYGEQEHDCNSYDGIFGLGYYDTYRERCGFRNMMRQGLVDNPIFSFYMNNEKKNSELIFGGIDPNHFTGNFCYADVVARNTWTIECDRVEIGNRRVMGRVEALIDSGTSLILCPADFIDAFNELVGDPDQLDCSDMDEMQDISFIISGCRFTLSPSDYMIEEEEDEQYDAECMCGIDASDTQSFVLGNVFMRKYYSVFNMAEGTIGFALARK